MNTDAKIVDLRQLVEDIEIDGRPITAEDLGLALDMSCLVVVETAVPAIISTRKASVSQEIVFSHGSDFLGDERRNALQRSEKILAALEERFRLLFPR